MEPNARAAERPGRWRAPAVVAALLATLALPAAAQEIYKTVDADGNVIYTDQPPTPESQPMELPPLTVAEPFEIPPPLVGEPASEEELTLYDGVALVSPEPEQHFWGTGGTLRAQLEAPHELRNGDSVNFYLDGTLAGNVRAYGIDLSEVYRGEHSVYAEIVGADGRVLARTEPVTFYMHQQSILNPNSPRNRGGN